MITRVSTLVLRIRANHRTPSAGAIGIFLLALAILLLTAIAGRTTPVLGPWVPLFRGVEHSCGTNLPSAGDFPNRQVVNALRVDLTDPDIRLMTTPRLDNYVAGSREIGGLTVSGFLQTYQLQAAINANFFDARDYYLPDGYPMDVYGLAINEGTVVSRQDGPSHAAVLLFDATNHATFIPTNWPAKNVAGVFTAVSGNHPLVIAGKNVIPRTAREVDPRTLFGLSQDRRYLYLVTIDGRQPGYSDGSNEYESAQWLLLLGVYDGVNMDGGGSTTLVIQDSTGAPVRLNRSSAVADSGHERTVGSHFGLFARPLPGFINDVVALADDSTARITWTTVAPADARVEYGTTTDLDNSSELQSAALTNHTVQLSGLTPATGYYFRVISSTETEEHASALFLFRTTNYVTTNGIFEFTQPWTYSTADPGDLSWTNPEYDDSGWSGPGPGLLWVDVRPGGPNRLVGPKNTEMPVDPDNSGFPYITYYFRTHFAVSTLVPGSQLAFSAYVDDGAIFYLNGTEIQRLRMPSESSGQTLASTFPCGGDATCLDEFTIPLDSVEALIPGDNVLAAEVHNYNARSSDITFGLSLSRIEPSARQARIGIRRDSGSVILEWEASGAILQAADSPDGPWTDVEEASGSPFTVETLQSSRFYRLRN